jgi:segregation and condensation protein B
LNSARKESSTFSSPNLTQNLASEYARQAEQAVVEIVSPEHSAHVIESKPKTRKPKSRPVLPSTSTLQPESVELPVFAAPIKQPRRRAPRLPDGLAGGFAQVETVRRAVNTLLPVLVATDSGKEADMQQLKRIVEAILFAADRPMTAKQIQQVFPELELPQLADIQQAIEAIIGDYQQRPVGLKLLASGYRFQVREGLAYWVSRLFEEKPARYSRALLETIAIIAYRQPVTRGEIEEIRGVAVSTSIIQTLLEREWVRVIGHKEVPGRPALFSTTRQFLDYFNLSSLDELPSMAALVDIDFSNTLQPQPEQDYSERPKTDSFETSQTQSTEQAGGG